MRLFGPGPWIFLCLFWMMFPGDGGIGRAETIRVGYFSLAPFAAEGAEGDATGAAVSIFLEIAEEMGIDRVVLESYPLKRLVRSLELGGIDAALTLGKSPDRTAKFVYPERPFFRMQPAVAIREGHTGRNIRSASDLLGLRIGTYADGFLSPMMRNPALDRLPLTGSDVIGRGLAMVDAGHLDAFYNPDAIPLEFLIRRDGLADRLRVVPLPEPPTGLYTVFSRTAAPRFLKSYEAALRKIWSPETVRDHLRRAFRDIGTSGVEGDPDPAAPAPPGDNSSEDRE